jgi:hypothetical protein
MPSPSPSDATRWAERPFDGAVVGDQRRPTRAVPLGAALRATPAAWLPRQLPPPAAREATDALLPQGDVTPAALLTPRGLQTPAVP